MGQVLRVLFLVVGLSVQASNVNLDCMARSSLRRAFQRAPYRLISIMRRPLKPLRKWSHFPNSWN